jgi:hypothetical protein
MGHKYIKILALVFLLVLLAAVPVSANANTTTETYRLEDVTQTLNAGNSCVGAVQGTLTYDAVIHVTENVNSYHSVLIMNGTAVVEPLNPAYPTFTGQFSEIQVRQTQKDQDFKVFVVTQMGDGLEFHITFKVSYFDQGPVIDIWSIACGN